MEPWRGEKGLSWLYFIEALTEGGFRFFVVINCFGVGVGFAFVVQGLLLSSRTRSRWDPHNYRSECLAGFAGCQRRLQSPDVAA